MDRERIKAMVREVLSRKLADSESTASSSSPELDTPRVRRGSDPSDSRSRDLVCEADVRRARGEGRRLEVAPGTIVTPLARETAVRLGVDIVERDKRRTEPPATPRPAAELKEPAVSGAGAENVVALGADHGGFALKEDLKRFLEEEAGFVVVDFGTDSAESVDYPEFAHRVAGAVSRGEASHGILIDGMGLGSAMAANRHDGVRAAPVNGIMETINAREHNDANVLCLGGRMVGDLLARAITMVFLTTRFAGGRHARRVAAIELG